MFQPGLPEALSSVCCEPAAKRARKRLLPYIRRPAATPRSQADLSSAGQERGFSLQAAQELAADDAIDEWAVLDHLGALVDKSLVLVDNGELPRYRMLETTCAFALERLAGRGETPRAMRRHAEVMLALFERYWDDLLQGVPVATIFARLAPAYRGGRMRAGARGRY